MKCKGNPWFPLRPSFVPPALCIMYYVLCIMYYVLCIMYYVLCIMYYVLCIMR
jgi:hypothetical protein